MLHTKLEISFQYHRDCSKLNGIQIQLLNEAFGATKTAYAPYSQYFVGAALVLEDGTILKASNQENASYPCGICAERNLLFYYGSNYASHKILKLAISTKSRNPTLQYPPAPCGLCRQVLVEYERNNKSSIELIIGQPDQDVLVFPKCEILLPFGFLPEHLNPSRT
ncbi:MAG: cytidine deaminase [Saprospiraceae bacterium]|nr:cytidine deaminase [Saprospiraceae bacterium]